METDFVASAMLFGFMAMLMVVLPAFLNTNDVVRHTSWSLFSNSIKIVCGVLIGGTFSDVITWSIGSPDSDQLLLVHGVLYAIWYFFLQMALLCRVHLARGRISARCGVGTVDKKEEDWNLLEQEEMENTELSLEVEAPLLSITCGTSGMYFWAQLQVKLVHSSAPDISIASALFMVLAVFIFSEIMASCMESARSRFINQDGKSDDLEKRWNDYIVKCEESLVVYQMSFLSVQTLRMGITGQMPKYNGDDPPNFQASREDIILLLSSSALFVTLFLVTHYLGFPKSRRGAMFTNALGTSTALCWLYVALWIHKLLFSPGAFGAICEAGLTTILGLITIFLMVLSRNDWRNKKVEHELKQTFITPMSTWIGFSWKYAFKLSFATLNDRFHYLPPAVQEGFFTIVLVSLLLPSWIWYVLPQEFGLRKQIKAPERFCMQFHIQGMPITAVNGLYERQKDLINDHPYWRKLEDHTKLLLWRKGTWYVTNTGDELTAHKIDWIKSLQEDDEDPPLPSDICKWEVCDRDGCWISLDRMHMNRPVPVLKYRAVSSSFTKDQLLSNYVSTKSTQENLEQARNFTMPLLRDDYQYHHAPSSRPLAPVSPSAQRFVRPIGQPMHPLVLGRTLTVPAASNEVGNPRGLYLRVAG